MSTSVLTRDDGRAGHPSGRASVDVTFPHKSFQIIIMLAQVNKTTTVSAVSTVTKTTTTARRGATIVRKNSKGGEEGAPSFGNDAYGTEDSTMATLG